MADVDLDWHVVAVASLVRDMNKEIFSSLEPILKAVEQLSALVLLGALLYSVWRTGSLHLIRHRLWCLLYGKESVSDGEVRAFVDGRSSLMAFRFNSGVPVRTLEQAKRMLAWANENDEDVHAIAVAGRHFDRENLRLNEPLPKIGKKFAVISLAGFFGTLAVALFLQSFSTRAYYRIRDTGLWFSASSIDVREVGPSLSSSFPWVVWSSPLEPLTLEMCKAGKIPNGTFGKSQSAVLCQLLLAPDKDAQLAEAIRGQRQARAWLILCIYGYLALSLHETYRLAAAWRMKERLARRPKQMVLPFE